MHIISLCFHFVFVSSVVLNIFVLYCQICYLNFLKVNPIVCCVLNYCSPQIVFCVLYNLIFGLIHQCDFVYKALTQCLRAYFPKGILCTFFLKYSKVCHYPGPPLLLISLLDVLETLWQYEIKLSNIHVHQGCV